MRASLPFLLSIAAVAPLVPSQAVAQPVAWPTDTLFQATTCGGKTSFDPVGDSAAKGERDIVGSGTYPALSVAGDGTYVYLRVRLDDTPITTAGGKPLSAFGWGFGLDTNANKTDAEYNIITSGITETVDLIRTSDSAVLMTFKPTLDASQPGPAGQTFKPVYVQVKATGDGSAFGGDADYFLTMAVPMAGLSSATSKDPSPINWGLFYLWGASSSNGTALNADHACWNDASGPVNLASSVSNPIWTNPVTCTDKLKNGQETDVDCGGSSCPGCAVGKGCAKGSDCASGVCDPTKKVCLPAPKPDLGLPDLSIDASADLSPQPDLALPDLPAPDLTPPDLTQPDQTLPPDQRADLPLVDAAADLSLDAAPDAGLDAAAPDLTTKARLGGGGGCSVASATDPSPVLLVSLLILWAARRRTRRETDLTSS